MVGRESLLSLLAAAKGDTKPFDCVLIEDSSRLTRNMADGLRTTEIFSFHGVDVVFVSQGIDTSQESSRMMVAMQGMVDEQFLVGLRQKVHRGQEGRVLSGYNPGGKCYGYMNVPIEDPSRKEKYGRPAVLGVRQEVVLEEAKIVRGIFQMYARTGFGQHCKTLERGKSALS
jgi:DNA invertase Pin-like site-specific DNA recombinase